MVTALSLVPGSWEPIVGTVADITWMSMGRSRVESDTSLECAGAWVVTPSQQPSHEQDVLSAHAFLAG